jgi:hypothetical protein
MESLSEAVAAVRLAFRSANDAGELPPKTLFLAGAALLALEKALCGPCDD